MKDLINLADDVLVTMYINGSEESLQILINRHKNVISSYIYMMVKQQALTEDIFQETFIKVIKTLRKGKYNANGRFTSWVMRISHNLIIDHFRKQKNMKMISNDNEDYQLLDTVKFSESTIEDKIVSDQISSDVVKLLDFLPANQQEIIRLRHFMGLSFKDIAEETGVSINTALGRMRYAITNLRAIVEERQISLTA